MSVVLRGGRIIDSEGERTLDVELGEDGRIAAVGTGLSGDVNLDASGCVISPGFVDLHAHLRLASRDARLLDNLGRDARVNGPGLQDGVGDVLHHCVAPGR